MKRTIKKLAIQPTTIRPLSLAAIATVSGGNSGFCATTGTSSCYKTGG
jgi:hypothetical protein